MPRSPRGNARKIFFGIAAPDERSTAAVTFFNPRVGDDDLCSGVVIADGALLTAGHCACGTNYQILFGSSINDPLQPPDRVGVFEMHRFPKYNCRQVEVGQPGLDYALLKFDPGQLANGTSTYEIAEIKSPAEVRKGFRTFPSVNISVVSKNMRIVGYGRTERNTLGERLQAVVPVYSWFCSEPWAAALGCAPYSEIMLSQLGSGAFRSDARNVDTCGGDSGGPVFSSEHNVDRRTGQISIKNYLVAITSRGMQIRQPNPELICGGGGIYEVVARKSVYSWLNSLGIKLPN